MNWKIANSIKCIQWIKTWPTSQWDSHLWLNLWKKGQVVKQKCDSKQIDCHSWLRVHGREQKQQICLMHPNATVAPVCLDLNCKIFGTLPASLKFLYEENLLHIILQIFEEICWGWPRCKFFVNPTLEWGTCRNVY